MDIFGKRAIICSITEVKGDRSGFLHILFLLILTITMKYQRLRDVKKLNPGNMAKPWQC